MINILGVESIIFDVLKHKALNYVDFNFKTNNYSYLIFINNDFHGM